MNILIERRSWFIKLIHLICRNDRQRKVDGITNAHKLPWASFVSFPTNLFGKRNLRFTIYRMWTILSIVKLFDKPIVQILPSDSVFCSRNCYFLFVWTEQLNQEKIVLTIILPHEIFDTQFFTNKFLSCQDFVWRISIRNWLRKFAFFPNIANGSVPPTVLLMLINEHLVKDEIALDFLLEVCLTFKQEKGLSSLVQTLKKGNIESR